MAWLVRGDRVLASLEVPEGRRARARGLIGRDCIEGAMLLTPCRSVHTFGMKFPIDVAFLDKNDLVVATITMRSRRMSRPRLGAKSAIEAKAGSFERWELEVGQELEIRS